VKETILSRSIIAFQGEHGAYSEAAVREMFGRDAETLPLPAFEDVFASIEGENVKYGVIPIENSLAGSIHRNYDLMLRHELSIQREYHLRVSHCLLGLPGAGLDVIRRAHSHPQALAQCEGNLKRLGLDPVVELDTAGAARLVREMGNPEDAAIASRLAGEVYGLEILVENMEDYEENFTRFLALSLDKPALADPGDGDYKSSIVFSLSNIAGSLYKALSVFALRNIDLTKIESRPFPRRPLEYLFYIDFAGHVRNEDCEKALLDLSEMAPFLRVLGSYPRDRLPTGGGNETASIQSPNR
jgi:prephenate dehydratase